MVLVTAVTTATTLRHFVNDRVFIFETNASGYVLAAVLSTYDDEWVPHPVAGCWKTHTPVQHNYNIYD